jgi:hypothetical protein
MVFLSPSRTIPVYYIHSTIACFQVSSYSCHPREPAYLSRYSYGLDGRGSIPDRVKMFLLSIASRPALGPTQPPIQWVPGAVSPGAKRHLREADLSPPSSAEVKNSGAIISLHHMSSWRGALLLVITRKENSLLPYLSFYHSMPYIDSVVK